MPTVKKTTAKNPVASITVPPLKQPRAKKVAAVVPKAKPAVKAPVVKSVAPVAAETSQARPGIVIETERLVARIVPANSISEFLVAVHVPGRNEAIRYIGVNVDTVKGKRLSREKVAEQVAKLAFSYENRRTSNKAFRGYSSITAVVLRRHIAEVAQATYTFAYRCVEATSF